MRITNLFSGFALAVCVLLSSFAMAAESHAQHEKQKAKSTSQDQSKEMAHEHHQYSADEHAQMQKQKNVVGQPSSEKQAQTQLSKQPNVQKGDNHAHH
ncbi:hypothetical protein LCH18_13835 [Acinetobacter johnsonii]|uniref:hypothetical protein n=1 Tax=Acinetobacter johnsonii TaxID=40214 RepID=UPI001CCE9594|nr:hypothetical protein [Acinetobacter johnsonii]UBQ37230.1 hypothetical protein LCH18_13835 [Acinetobacter johnsonii]